MLCIELFLCFRSIRRHWCSLAASWKSNFECRDRWPTSWRRCTKMVSRKNGCPNTSRIQSPTTTWWHSRSAFQRRASTGLIFIRGNRPIRQTCRMTSPVKNTCSLIAASIWLTRARGINHEFIISYFRIYTYIQYTYRYKDFAGSIRRNIAWEIGSMWFQTKKEKKRKRCCKFSYHPSSFLFPLFLLVLFSTTVWGYGELGCVRTNLRD